MKNTKVQTERFLKRDADVEAEVSFVGDMIRIKTESRYDSPAEHTVRLTETEKRLMEEVQRI